MLYLDSNKGLYKVSNKMILSEQCISITELKKKVNTYVKDLKEPKYIFVNNKPKAVLVSIKEYEVLSMAFNSVSNGVSSSVSNVVSKEVSVSVSKKDSDLVLDGEAKGGIDGGAKSSVSDGVQFDAYFQNI